MLYAFADGGEAKILAIISFDSFETTMTTTSVSNANFNEPDILFY